MTEPSGPTAFVAWAHRGHGWTSEQEDAWAEQVSAFTALLRLNGVDADVDLYHQHEQGMDWNRYGFRAIADHELVFVPVSDAWIQRFVGTEIPTAGAGAARESDALLDLYNADRDAFRRKVALVYLPGTDTDEVPMSLGGLQRFYVTELTEAGLEDVLRYAHRVPRWERPPLGAAPSFPPVARLTADVAARDLRALEGSLQGSTSAGDAAVRGIQTALATLLSGSPATSPPLDVPQNPSGQIGGWQPVAEPPALQPTLFDDLGRHGVFGPVLEVQLLTLDETPRMSGPALRALAHTVVAALTPSHAAADPIMGGQATEVAQPSTDLFSDRLDVTCPEPRPASPFNGQRSVTPAQLAQVIVSRGGSVSASMYLTHDLFSAVVNTASLTRDIGQLINVAAAYLPAGVHQVVPIVRVGPLLKISPGDPAEMGSNSRSLPWHGESASTDGGDSIDRTSLTAPSTAEELASQLVNALQPAR